MKTSFLVSLLAVSAICSNSKAGLTVSGDAGIDVYSGSEMGFNLYPGYDLQRDFVPEMQLGFRYASVIQPLNADGLSGSRVDQGISPPAPPRIPACGTTALGSSNYAFATGRYAE